MKTIVKASLLIACTNFAFADTFNTSRGTLDIREINHATATLSWENKTIDNPNSEKTTINAVIDPVGDAAKYKSLGPVDLILITDIHGDHFNSKTLSLIANQNTRIIAPKAVIDRLPDPLKLITTQLNNNQSTMSHNIKIDAIAMYNLPESSDAKHTKGRGNGYVLTFADKRIYFSGDTADIPEMRALKDIDIAFVTMNLPYTMTVQAAANGVLDFKPKVVYPYHYRGKKDGKASFSDIKAFKRLVNAGNKDIQVVLKDWYK